MYQYDQFDQQLVEQRCLEFRNQVDRRLAGTISEEEFKPLRLMNGLYLQLHAYMLRVAIPYGVLSSAQMQALAEISERYDRGYGHFTTRQNIQFNWPQLVETPDILTHLASVQMHALQTSGNCIRNITSDPFAGVAADEEVDPRPVCELLRQWSTLHPEFAYLPRKFKFAVTGSANDRAAIKVHDIGLRLKQSSESAEPLIDVWVGGGQGRTPKIAQLFKADLTLSDFLPYLEALLRVYNQHGRRDNKYKARIKILLAETGLEKLQQQVETVYQQIDRAPFSSVSDELFRIKRRFTAPEYQVCSTQVTELEQSADNESGFALWLKNNLRVHKEAGHSIAMVSLKNHGAIPGDASATQMKAVADLAERYSSGEIRVTHRQNLVLPHVRNDQLAELWKGLQAHGLATGNVDLPSDIIACPGLDYCALATARSIPIAQAISSRLENSEIDREPGKLAINISGCINACAHHHVAGIGILGLDRAGVENYQITLGGRSDQNAKVGKRVGPGVSASEVPEVVERVVNLYLDRRVDAENFSDTFERIGIEPFKTVVYQTDAAPVPESS